MKRKHIIILCVLVAVFALLLTLALLGKFVWGWFEDQPEEAQTPTITPDLTLGEDYYYFGGKPMNNAALIFSQLDRSDIFQIYVKPNSGENYFFYHDQSNGKNYFMLGECDDQGTVDLGNAYMPPISERFQSFDYNTLYDDTTKIPQLLAVVGAPAIAERIFPEDGNFNQEFLSRYGLSQADDPAYFEIIPYKLDPANGKYLYTTVERPEYLIRQDTDGKYYYITEDGGRGEAYTGAKSDLIPAADVDNTKRVYIGSPTVDDSGYYLYLEGRNIVYTTRSSYLADVVEKDLGYYIAPRLVTESENNYAFMLTPGFKIEDGKFVDAAGTPVTDGATVGVTTETVRTYDTNGGGDHNAYGVFEMIDLKTHEDKETFAAVFSGKNVGDTMDVVTLQQALTKSGKAIDYHIIKVAGIIQGDTYIEHPESPITVTATDRVVVAYTDGTRTTVGGMDAGAKIFYGYLNLADAKTPEIFRAALVGKTVGGADFDETVHIEYDGYNNDISTMKFELKEIISIVDADKQALDAADYGTTVTFAYRLLEDGVLVSESSMVITIPPAGSGEGQFDNPKTWTDMVGGNGVATEMTAYWTERVARGLLGLKKGSCLDDKGNSTKVIEVPFAVEYLSDFTIYDDMKIEYFVTYQEELSFAFTNEHNVFHGSNLYEIKNGEKAMYSLDPDVANEVLTLFQDLKGDETVAVGLDHETIDKYSLYDYRLSYSMPFDVYSESVGDIDYYYHKRSIGYNLYISRKMEDGSRYIGSEQYDIVVKLEDGSQFDFLDWSFYTKWMQNSLLMVSYENLRRMVFDLNFEGAEGSDYNTIWGFDITVDQTYPYPTTYYDEETGKDEVTYEAMPRLYAALANLGLHSGVKDYATLRNLMTYTIKTYNPKNDVEFNEQSTMAGKFVQIISENTAYVETLSNAGWQDLDAVYGNKLTSNGVDMYGSDNLRGLLLMLNTMRYWGEAADDLSEEEIASITSGDYTMRMALTLIDATDKTYTEKGYVLTFYNYGMHSLVTVTDVASGERSDLFYIQSREVRRLAEAVVGLTKGEVIDHDKY